MLAGILRVNGWREAIIVSKLSGLVVKGHGRLQTALHMGLKEVPVEYQHYDDAQAELADMIADNRVAQHSYVDALKLGSLLKKISGKGQENLGYSQEEIDLFMAAEYVAPTATDRTFKVLETLKMSKEAKAAVTLAVQRFCLAAGKEVEWGEALAAICATWMATLPKLPDPPAQPKAEPAKPKPAAKAKPAAPAQPAEPGELVSVPEEKEVKFKVRYVAATTNGGQAVHVVRAEGADRYYLKDPAHVVAAKAAKEAGKKLTAIVSKKNGEWWVEDIDMDQLAKEAA